MLESNRRGNLAWMLFMVVAALLFIGTGAFDALFALGVMSAGLMFLWLTTRPQNVNPLQHASRQVSASPTARTASGQARHRPDFDDYYHLQDVGLIVDQPGPDGLKLRRARLVSLDDEAVRPYAVINAPRYGHPAQVLVRYEITDSSGQQQFIYEMDYWMRPGENAILPDYRLPLKGNDRLSRTGKWDLQVWINGGLVAAHTFSVSPSAAERRRQFGLDGEAQARLELEYEPAPMSLDELLKQQQASRSQNH